MTIHNPPASPVAESPTGPYTGPMVGERTAASVPWWKDAVRSRVPVLGFAVLLVFQMVGLRQQIGDLRADLRGDIGDLRADLQGDIGNLRTEMQALRADVQGDIGDLRDDLRSEMSDLRDDIRTEMSDLRVDLGGQINRLETRITRLETLVESRSEVPRSGG